jgi:hypothetical protein
MLIHGKAACGVEKNIMQSVGKNEPQGKHGQVHSPP